MDPILVKTSCDKLPHTQALKCFSCVIYGTKHAKLALGRADSASMFEQCLEEMELVSNSLYSIQPSAAARQAGKGHNRCPMPSPFKSAWLCSMVTQVNATHHFHSLNKHCRSFSLQLLSSSPVQPGSEQGSKCPEWPLFFTLRNLVPGGPGLDI